MLVTFKLSEQFSLIQDK